jgi:hypothetical protein
MIITESSGLVVSHLPQGKDYALCDVTSGTAVPVGLIVFQGYHSYSHFALVDFYCYPNNNNTKLGMV